MFPVHDVDALLLLATALSSKRRPAELVEVVAAVDLLQGGIPSERKLVEAFARMSAHGLLASAADGFVLTAAAQALMAGQPAKGEVPGRIQAMKAALGAYNPAAELPPLELALKDVSAAIAAHKGAGEGAGKNLLVPKPKPAEADRKHHGPRPGQRARKPAPPRRRG